jgi:hypothetical protein
LYLDRAEYDSQHDGEDDEDDNDDAEAPPLHFARAARVFDALGQLHVAGFGVVLDLLGVLFCLLDLRVLQLDRRREVFHQGLQFDHRALDLLDVVVAGSHVAENGVGRGGAVGFQLVLIALVRDVHDLVVLRDWMRGLQLSGTRPRCPNLRPWLLALQSLWPLGLQSCTVAQSARDTASRSWPPPFCTLAVAS